MHIHELYYCFVDFVFLVAGLAVNLRFDHFSLEPEWTAAATQVNEQTGGRVKLGAVDATVHQGLASRYGVSLTPKSSVNHFYICLEIGFTGFAKSCLFYFS